MLSKADLPASPGLIPVLKGVTNLAGVPLVAPVKGLIGVMNAAAAGATKTVERTGVDAGAKEFPASGCCELAGANPEGRLGFNGELVNPTLFVFVAPPLIRGDLNGFGFGFPPAPLKPIEGVDKVPSLLFVALLKPNSKLGPAGVGVSGIGPRGDIGSCIREEVVIREELLVKDGSDGAISGSPSCHSLIFFSANASAAADGAKKAFSDAFVNPVIAGTLV